MQTEQKLIKRIKKKQDKEAANTLISYYYKEIYAYVYRQTGNEELAKDLTQDIFYMKCFEERTFQDISQTLNISENTVKSRFYKMIRQIKSEVDYQ